MNVRELLIDTHAHVPPINAVGDLSVEDATRRLPHAPHTIAEIVGHLNFWQAWFHRRCTGVAEPMAASSSLGWPAVEPESWVGVREQFVTGLNSFAALGQDPAALDRSITPAIEFPFLANYTLRDAFTHVAHHNAHHLGQIVTLRQLMERWPPPSGSWTW